MPYAIDPELAQFLPMFPTTNTGDIEHSRLQVEVAASHRRDRVDVANLEIEDHLIPGPPDAPEVFVRTYRPMRTQSPMAALLHIHGGGFIVGSVKSEFANVAGLANRVGALVASVEYRLAPEHPYPAGLDDCYATLTWLASNSRQLDIDADRIGVYGSSAGGGLAAGLALLARDRGGPSICFQFLNTPELDDRGVTPSMHAFVDTPVFTASDAEFSWDCYLGNAAGDVSPYAAPARATDLRGLPPSYVSTMEFDPLRDEGIEYALRMLQAGVRVELHSFPGTFHGSQLIPTAAISLRTTAEQIAVLRHNLRCE
jgi:acetyl esterase